MMDLGATVCRRGPRPSCNRCPLRARCKAFQMNVQENYPKPIAKPKTKTVKRHESTYVLIVVSEDRVFLQRRKPKGIWGGLFCFPEFSSANEWDGIQELDPCCFSENLEVTPHAFSHYNISIHSRWITVQDDDSPIIGHLKQICDSGVCGSLVGFEDAAELGLPAPIRSLLELVTKKINKGRKFVG
eukprot:GHVH01010936.1.p1 GENE.GHVH01010936.1~~GHVH01010936.1.p1  ORF type:complete len:186 (+),score=14.12 GHVH01010936.1:108-665(+)